MFGIRKAGDVVGTVGNAYLARIEKQHEILSGFSGTNWIPGAEHRIPVAPVDGPILTVTPGFVAYPPELSYPLQDHTNEPAIVVRQSGKSRLVYFPGDIERTMWRSGHTDLARLLQNAIRWTAGATQPVTVQGDGVIETFAWETQAGFAVHLLNYTNPAMHRGWIRKFYPIGGQKVSMSLAQGKARDASGTVAGGEEYSVHRRLRYDRVHDSERTGLRSSGAVFSVGQGLPACPLAN